MDRSQAGYGFKNSDLMVTLNVFLFRCHKKHSTLALVGKCM